jgi:TolB-like protein/class 3 adenylate cyclase/Tfp pilus assembly protein PilF
MAVNHLAGKLAVIMHADVAASTSLVRQNEQLAHGRIQEAFQRFKLIIEKYQGHVHELRGDALLAEFMRPSDAVNAALAFQSENQQSLAEIDDDIRPMLRIGISMGEIVIADNTLTGTGVILAQRVEQLAEPGGLCVTAAIHEALPMRLPIDQQDLGEIELKGFDEQVRIYRVDLRSDETIPQPEGKGQHRRSSSKRGIPILLVGIALAIAVGAAYWFKAGVPPETPVSAVDEAVADTAKPSIAVLPFANFSDDKEQEYFSDGLTEDLITDISRISGLDVIARNSTFAYKGQSPDVREVGKHLNVSHVIEGSVRKAGNTVRITIQLVNAHDGKHLWAERYDRELSDVFAIQDEVIGKIVAALSLKLTPEEKKQVARHGTENLQAYDLYMRGRQQESFFTRDSNIEAQRYYEQAVALDPNYAEAWAHLGQIHTLNGQFGWVEDIEAADARAKQLAEKSIELDPEIPFSRFAYARILARDSIGQHQRAIEQSKKAIELDPNYADAYAYLGQLYITTGQAEKAPDLVRKAMRINPVIPFWYYYTLGFARFFMGDYETAVETIEVAVERNPNVFFVRLAYAAALGMAGRIDDAEWQVEELAGLGFGKPLEQVVSEMPVQDPEYRALYREGLTLAGLR